VVIRRQAAQQSAGPTVQSDSQAARPSDSATDADLERLNRALTEVAD
jgi:hypothetical protein